MNADMPDSAQKLRRGKRRSQPFVTPFGSTSLCICGHLRPSAVSCPAVRVLLAAVVGLWLLLLWSAAAQEDVDWTWDAGEEAMGADTAPPAPDSTEYDELLKENLELRRRILEATREGEEIRKRNALLAGQVRELEQKIVQLTSNIRDLQNKKAAAADDPDRVMELETQLALVEEEKAKLANDMAAIRAELEAREREQAARLRASRPPSAGAVEPGSDLFRNLEAENAGLRQRLAELELARRSAVDAQAAQAELEAALFQSQETGAKQREALQRLVKYLPKVRGELLDLRSALEEKDRELKARERELAGLKQELRRREHRLSKAERMTRVLESARGRVDRAADLEMRDIHYNMAVVYAREGRVVEAEREYLRALDLDPYDADTHYNLGILYDDELGDKERAAMHYRKFLELRPDSPDIDQVRGWLMDLESLE